MFLPISIFTKYKSSQKLIGCHGLNIVTGLSTYQGNHCTGGTPFEYLSTASASVLFSSS